MIKQDVVIKNLDTGFVSKLVNAAEQFRSQIMFRQGTRLINVKSVMGVMAIAQPNTDIELTVVCDGRDEKKALQAITDLIAENAEG
jgi:phosphotransferase system HPr (HPr) family protein